MDFFPASSSGLLVIQPEATSVLNAYSFLKTAVFRLLSRFFPRVVLNEGRGLKDAAMGLHLRDIVTRNLGIPLEYVGFLLRDEAVPRSVAERTPLALSRSESPFACGAAALAARISAQPGGAPPRLFEDDEDLSGALEEAFRDREPPSEDQAVPEPAERP